LIGADKKLKTPQDEKEEWEQKPFETELGH
jgi:hypothetical protein